jgi:hypothetical protein
MNDERFLVRQLGDRIGFGNMMHIASNLWREKLELQGLEGGEFSVGPCVAGTVPCECSHPCDWCNGAGWLTPHVKELKDEKMLNRCKCGAQMSSEMLDNGVTHKYCPKCHKQNYEVE